MLACMQPLHPPSKSSKWTARILVGAVVLIAAAITVALIVTRPSRQPTERLVFIRMETVVTLAQYERLQTGMTYQQVVSILGGEGCKLPQDEKGGEVTYSWWGAEIDMKMDATFQDGKLIQKTHSGLK